MSRSESTGGHVVSRPGSDRRTNLCEDPSEQDGGGIAILEDQRDLHFPTSFLDTEDSHCAPRLGTAVLAKGNRPLLLGSSGSDTCLLPEIDSTFGCLDGGGDGGDRITVST